MDESRDEGAVLAALWRDHYFASQRFEASPYPTALPPAKSVTEQARRHSQLMEDTDFVTFAVISDTHGKHGKFAGFEVPGCVKSACEYLTAAGEHNKVAAEIEKVASTAKHDFLHAPLCTAAGQVYPSKTMSIMPVVLLSGNRKDIMVPPPWQPVPRAEAETNRGESRSPGGKECDGPCSGGIVVPYADVLIHCGDFTMKGSEGEMESFCQFLAQLPHKHKLLVAGNHEVSLDAQHFARADVKKRWKLASAPKDLPARLRRRLAQAGAVYLEDETASLGPFRCRAAAGTAGSEAQVWVRCFGSPVQPAYHDWAFQKARGGEISEHWERVLPAEGAVDVLITHGPPLGRGDRPGVGAPQQVKQEGSVVQRCAQQDGRLDHASTAVAAATLGKEGAAKPETGDSLAVAEEEEEEEGGRMLGWDDVRSGRAGCAALLERVQRRVRPLLHLFGHVHADHASDSSDGVTLFVNASLTDHHNNLRAAARVKTLCVPASKFATRQHPAP